MAPVDHYVIKKNAECPGSATIIIMPKWTVENCNPIEQKKKKKDPFYWGLKTKRELRDQGIKK